MLHKIIAGGPSLKGSSGAIVPLVGIFCAEASKLTLSAKAIVKIAAQANNNIFSF